jgi:hypothetical protein
MVFGFNWTDISLGRQGKQFAFGEKKIVHYIGCTQKNTDSVESGTDPGEMAFNFTPVPSVGATGQAGWATEFDGFFQL